MTQQIYVFPSHVMESKSVLDSGFHVVDSGFRVLDSSLCQWKLGFWIPDSNRYWDSGFLELCFRDSKTKDSGFHKQNVPGFRIQQAKRLPYMGRIFNNPVI